MKDITRFLAITLTVLLLSSCISDDIINDQVDESLSIINPIDTIGFGDTYQFRSRYLDNVGESQSVSVEWSSSDSEIINITETGLASGIITGTATITAEYQGIDNYLVHEIDVNVGINTVEAEIEEQIKEGNINTTSSYLLEGDFEVFIENDNLKIEIANNYRASTALPGLYLYLSNNPNSIAGALEIDAVSTFNGAHSYTIPNIGIDDYKYLLYFCKPFNVKVGDGEY